MPTDLQHSETARALMRAFAGECQARNRYELAAAVCRKQNLQVLEFAFRLTARQEQAHARIFWKHLAELKGQSVTVDGAYPVEVSNDVAELLRFAQHDEYEEHDPVYPAFAGIAAEEGFPAVAASFRQIAAIERIHGERFGLLAEQLTAGTLFVSHVKTGWMCLNCGHVQESLAAPKLCPTCGHEQGWFVRLELMPYVCPGGAGV